ncbi:hypothetical protein GQX74_009272 [Glossina fuscipes]|nr:hypothetical protein GQX74_009272 [Glossina fuscipes]
MSMIASLIEMPRTNRCEEECSFDVMLVLSRSSLLLAEGYTCPWNSSTESILGIATSASSNSFRICLACFMYGVIMPMDSALIIEHAKEFSPKMIVKGRDHEHIRLGRLPANDGDLQQ